MAYQGSRDPSTQYQLGDEVVYLPEGVFTKVTSYNWQTPTDGVAKIVGYSLACGIVATADDIAPKSGAAKEPKYVREPAPAARPSPASKL